MPIYGKVSDLVGRKPVMLLGVGLFVLGSLLCGLAWSMGSLVAFRLIQGLGAGAVQPVGMTIVGDIYSVAERAKVQGYLAAVWAISSLVGPTLGGVFADYLSWRWIFFVNLPLGVAAAWMLWRRFDEKRVGRDPSAARPRIDVLGTVLLLVGTVALLVALLEGGVIWAWASPVSIGLLVGSAVVLTAFVLVERRAADPVLPLWVFRHRVVGRRDGGLPRRRRADARADVVRAAVRAGGARHRGDRRRVRAGGHDDRVAHRRDDLGADLPALRVPGHDPARRHDRPRGRRTPAHGRRQSSVLHLAAPNFVMGLGFGYAASPAIVAAQSSVGWQQRGVATGATLFARSVGSAVGVAAFGALANAVVRSGLGSEPTDLESLPPGVLDPAIHAVFVASCAVAVLLVVAAAFMPKQVDEVTD